ncbi:hypothetical protein DFH08DRAFT_960413 [Mycena albidolilacea]|uniref:Uncharacterized protein n=1 Tax=Mycena albidolilacea TaxID=1033008 RepID=A0AAD7A278_9AGAR|nr:hypothetical protein DFH08DRAFT_960413 [Mycena albidolilacea]
MAIALTFVDKKLLDTTVVGPDGGVRYTTTTTSGFRGRKITTISAASGLTGYINWREHVFVINGVQREWDSLKSRSGGIFSSEREWSWGNRPFHLKYHDSHKELLATPTTGNPADTVRFTTYHSHLLHDSERAAIYFPHQMVDEIERMFLLMAILQTEMHRQDVKAAASRNASLAGAAAA